MAKLPKNHTFYVREFLNNPGHHSTAFVFATVEFDRWENQGQKHVDETITLIIGDCARQIELAVSRDKSDLDKLDRLVRTLVSLRNHLADADTKPKP